MHRLTVPNGWSTSGKITCLIDGAVNSAAIESLAVIEAKCEAWSKLPAARFQERGDPTPYTAGHHNAQMIFTIIGNVHERMIADYSRASQEQRWAAAVCVTDALSAFGKEGIEIERLLACNRFAGISEEMRTPKGRRAAKPNSR